MNDKKVVEIEGVKIEWRDVPTFVSDGAIGAAWGGNLHRIMLGEFILNTEQGADKPTVRPSLNLVMTTEAVKELITYLQGLPEIDV